MESIKEEIRRLKKEIKGLRSRIAGSHDGPEIRKELENLNGRLDRVRQSRQIHPGPGDPMNIVRMARHVKRPTTLEWIDRIFDDFILLHGDRRYADDRAVVGGIARLDTIPVTVVGHQKGRDVKENIDRNFGMAHPEGYRKALRLMKEAALFGRPVITFIDTPGAYPGIGAEERGQAEAIARNMAEMFELPVPLIAVITGEGGSGGALALGVADRVFMLTHSIYSVISPEGCAAILWKDAARAPDAARALKLTSGDLLKRGIIDGIIKEPDGGAHTDPDAVAAAMKEKIQAALEELLKETGVSRLLEKRFRRYRRFGEYEEPSP